MLWDGVKRPVDRKRVEAYAGWISRGTETVPTSAKRSTCCGAGRVFWTADRGSEPAVVLWCRGGRLFASAFRKLPMSEFVDLANSTRLGRVFFVLSHQGSRGKGQVLPTVTNPQQSRGLLNIFIPSHRVTVVRWFFF